MSLNAVLQVPRSLGTCTGPEQLEDGAAPLLGANMLTSRKDDDALRDSSCGDQANQRTSEPPCLQPPEGALPPG